MFINYPQIKNKKKDFFLFGRHYCAVIVVPVLFNGVFSEARYSCIKKIGLTQNYCSSEIYGLENFN